ncbi:MAG TPA: LytTR family DNA-binding domain-containing protein [Usitatibacter sp.]|nr:LytTR family DNA-binding domain-containing protein [Usitatibacter sp.]
MSARPTALIADDEPLLRSSLKRMLGETWPDLEVVVEARNGREAIEEFERVKPDICFLDVHMPGVSGIDAARHIGRRARLVFVTAYDNYAVEAFRQEALDYLVKPVEPERLADTVARLQERLRSSQPLPDSEALLKQIATYLEKKTGQAPLRWIHATVGGALRVIPVQDIEFLRSDEKYTMVAWRAEEGKSAEALIRTPLKELMSQLDQDLFVQVHRSVVVNRRAISHINRDDQDRARVFLKGRSEALPVARSYLHLFKQM